MNLAILGMAVGLSLIFGLKAYLLIQLIILMVAGGAGVWMFYVQHQFEGVYWERGEDWSFVAAALQGSSFYKLPRILQWFSGNIGFHHIHHLSPRIPNYNLEKCHQADPLFQTGEAHHAVLQLEILHPPALGRKAQETRRLPPSQNPSETRPPRSTALTRSNRDGSTPNHHPPICDEPATNDRLAFGEDWGNPIISVACVATGDAWEDSCHSLRGDNFGRVSVSRTMRCTS